MSKYVVREAGQEIEVASKEEADILLEPGVSVDVVDDNGQVNMSYGCINAADLPEEVLNPKPTLPEPEPVEEKRVTRCTVNAMPGLFDAVEAAAYQLGLKVTIDKHKRETHRGLFGLSRTVENVLFTVEGSEETLQEFSDEVKRIQEAYKEQFE